MNFSPTIKWFRPDSGVVQSNGEGSSGLKNVVLLNGIVWIFKNEIKLQGDKFSAKQSSRIIIEIGREEKISTRILLIFVQSST